MPERKRGCVYVCVHMHSHRVSGRERKCVSVCVCVCFHMCASQYHPPPHTQVRLVLAALSASVYTGRADGHTLTAAKRLPTQLHNVCGVLSGHTVRDYVILNVVVYVSHTLLTHTLSLWRAADVVRPDRQQRVATGRLDEPCAGLQHAFLCVRQGHRPVFRQHGAG